MSDYNLDALGWYQFERLTQTLLRTEYGLTVECWGGSRDYGRDAYSQGPLKFPDRDGSSPGPFIFQAKFVQGANAAGADPKPRLVDSVKKEAARISKRVQEGKWRHPKTYALLTNAPLSADLRTEIDNALRASLPKVGIVQVGATDLDAWLDGMPNVRLAFPQILGLRDLQQLLKNVVNQDVINRSTLVLEEASELAEVFVPTQAYNDALNRLRVHRFVVLTGPPEMGKTSIARMIALARFTSGWQAFECRNPADFLRLFDKDSEQIFVADDAFGSTEYRPDLGQAWADELPSILRGLGPKHQIIWTSRPGPLNDALNQLYLQGKAEKFPDPSRVQVNAAALTLEEKALILYRHCKRAELPPDVIEFIRSNAHDVLQDENFTPLRIDRLVREQLPNLTGTGAVGTDALQEQLEEALKLPTRPMQTSFKALDNERRLLLLAMLEGDSGTTNLDDLAKHLERHLGRPPSSTVTDLASSLEDHFIRLRKSQ